MVTTQFLLLNISSLIATKMAEEAAKVEENWRGELPKNQRGFLQKKQMHTTMEQYVVLRHIEIMSRTLNETSNRIMQTSRLIRKI